MTEDHKQVGRNESEARVANEIISVDGEQARLTGDDSLAVQCECGDRQCHEPVTMTVDDYEEIRAEPEHFAVLAGHEILDCERVIAKRDGYLIVEKFGDAGKIAGDNDPRNKHTMCRLVVVDDIPEIRYLLKMLIAIEPSCTVVGEAGNGAVAIDVVDAQQPEVVVLDLEMPIMDGWHALPHLRRVSPTSHIIVFSSTAIDPRLEKRLSNLGADRFVQKGGDPRIIMEAIRDISLSGRDRQFSEGLGDGRKGDSSVNGDGTRIDDV